MFTPLGDKILLRPKSQPREGIEGGIVVPVSQAQDRDVAVVVSIGPDVPADEVWPGAVVVVQRGTHGTPMTGRGVEMRLVSYGDLLAVIE